VRVKLRDVGQNEVNKLESREEQLPLVYLNRSSKHMTQRSEREIPRVKKNLDTL